MKDPGHIILHDFVPSMFAEPYVDADIYGVLDIESRSPVTN